MDLVLDECILVFLNIDCYASFFQGHFQRGIVGCQCLCGLISRLKKKGKSADPGLALKKRSDVFMVFLGFLDEKRRRVKEIKMLIMATF